MKTQNIKGGQKSPRSATHEVGQQMGRLEMCDLQTIHITRLLRLLTSFSTALHHTAGV